MKQRILITGSRGMVGRRLASFLDPDRTLALTAGVSGTPDRAFDWSAPRGDAAALDGIDALYLVPPPMVADPAERIAQLLATARTSGLRKVVAISSLGVTFPTEPGDSPRLRVEEAVMNSGLQWTLLRPSGFMQNFSEGFMLPAIRQGVIASAGGAGRVAFVDAADIAELAATAVTQDGHAGRTYAVTGAAAFDFATVADEIGRASGRSVTYRALDEDHMRAMMESSGVPADYADILLRDQRAIREGHADAVTDTVFTLLGRPPRLFTDFVTEAAAQWR